MKKLLLTIALVISVLTINANPVDYQTARTIAENFAIAQRVPAPDVISLVPEQMFSQLYVFGFRGQKGFVIISADDRAIPILGYSLTTEFRSTNIPDHISAWLHDYENQISWLIDNHVEPSAETQSRWLQLLNPVNPNTPMTEIIVDALVETSWNQKPYYNNLCPMIGSEQTVTGCSATAMAQVMKRWNHPTSGHGSNSYQWSGQTLSANFDTTTYEWNNMPDSLNQSSTQAQVNAVATLMYHVGISLNMNYGIESTGGSGTGTNYSSVDNAPCAQFALQYYFNYKNSIRGIQYSNMTDAQWKNTLKNEFDNARPVIYQGADPSGGHSFICDGYDSQDFFHFNWGWGGRCDGFYAIGALNPSESGIGGNLFGTYSNDNAAVIGIEPIIGTIPQQTVVTANASDAAQGYVTGARTYNQYDTITITAFAREGYVFDHWNDGNRANPIYSVATSATFNRTAYFRPLPTDTLGYCEDLYYDELECNSDTAHWGIRYPSSALRPGRVIDAVQFIPYDYGEYTLIIYQGDSTNMTPVYTETFDVPFYGDWHNLVLASPYHIDTTRALWVTLKCVGIDKPFVITNSFSGSDNGAMYFENSAWRAHNRHTWMMRVLTSDSASSRCRYYVNIAAAPESCGYVTPSSIRVLAGTELTFVAHPYYDCKFVIWSDSCLSYKRTLTPTSDTTLTAVFEALRPDTTTYCVSDEHDALTSPNENPFHWAIMVRERLYSSGDSIKSIMFFDAGAATLDLAIYIGKDLSTAPLLSQSFTTTGSLQWIEVPLTNPVPCPVNDALWVAFTEPARVYAASASRYSGNEYGCYYSSDGVNWETLINSNLYFSWMVKVVTNHNDAPSALDNPQTLDVTLAPNPIHAGETAYIYGDWSDAEMDGMLVEVLTVDGRTITRTAPQTFPIAINGINAPGTYIIRIMTGSGEVQVRKLTVH